MSKNGTTWNVASVYTFNTGHFTMGAVKVIVNDYRNLFSRERGRVPHTKSRIE
jgi:hypothetical protein